MFDLPYGTYNTPEEAVASTVKVVQETGIQLVKLEGHLPEIVRVSRFLGHDCKNMCMRDGRGRERGVRGGRGSFNSHARVALLIRVASLIRVAKLFISAELSLLLSFESLHILQEVQKHAAVCCHIGVLPQTATTFASTGQYSALTICAQTCRAKTVQGAERVHCRASLLRLCTGGTAEEAERLLQQALDLQNAGG